MLSGNPGWNQNSIKHCTARNHLPHFLSLKFSMAKIFKPLAGMEKFILVDFILSEFVMVRSFTVDFVKAESIIMDFIMDTLTTSCTIDQHYSNNKAKRDIHGRVMRIRLIEDAPSTQIIVYQLHRRLTLFNNIAKHIRM